MKNSLIIFLIVSLMLFSLWLFPVMSWGNDEILPSEVCKPLIVQKNANALDLLAYNGYTIVQSNVNFNKVGEYVVNYLSKDDEVYSKPVTVIEQDEGYYYEQVTKENATDKRYFDVLASCKINEKQSAYAFGYKHRNGDIDVGDYFIDIFENGEKVSNILLYYNTKASITNLAADGDYLIAVGWYRNPFGIVQSLLFRVNTKTRVIERKYFGENGITIGHNLFVGENDYYLVGSTTSDQAPFASKESGTNSFILKINKTNLTISKTMMVGVKGDDKISDIVFDSNYLYVNQIYGESFEKNKLLKIDLFGNIVKTLELNNPYQLNVKKIILVEGIKYLLISSFVYEMQGMSDILYQVDDDLVLTKVFESENSTWEVADFMIENSIYNILFRKKNGKGGYKIELITPSPQEPIFSYIAYQERIIPHSWAGRQFIIGSDYQNQDLVRLTYNWLKVTKHPTTLITKNGPLNDYEVMINNEYIKHNPNLSTFDYEINCFGKYQGRYVFDEAMLMFVYRCDWEVQPLISVKNGEAYDKNIKITFNGSATLNNVAISSGHMITEEGNYLLQVIGKNEERKIIEFIVRSIASKVEENEVTQGYFTTSINDKNIAPEEFPLRVNFFPRANNPSISFYSNDWLYLIPVCATLAGVVVLIKTKS